MSPRFDLPGRPVQCTIPDERHMMSPTRTALSGVLTGLALVLVVGCTSGVDPTNPPAGSSPTASSTSPPVTESAAATPPAAGSSASPSRAPNSSEAEPAADVTIAISISGGRIEPNGAKIDVKRGQRVQITATSDVVDSLHVHGYDRYLDVGPGKPAELIFTADQSGVFEIEAHETAKIAARLVVS
jgi:hypothetical protein